MIQLYNRHTFEKGIVLPWDDLTFKDFRPFDLRYMNLSDYDMTGSIFEGMDLEEIEMNNSILVEANLENITAVEGIFTGVNMTKARVKGAKLSMATFAGAILEEADFSEIIFEGMINFKDIQGEKAKFRNIKNLAGAIFWNADCKNSDFEGSNFEQVNITDRTGVNLKGTIFEYLTRCT